MQIAVQTPFRGAVDSFQYLQNIRNDLTKYNDEIDNDKSKLCQRIIDLGINVSRKRTSSLHLTKVVAGHENEDSQTDHQTNLLLALGQYYQANDLSVQYFLLYLSSKHPSFSLCTLSLYKL